jgi:hypothetical protein
MAWLAICLPVMIIGVAVATVPVIHGTFHHREDGLREEPRPRAGPVARLSPTVYDSSKWTVCPYCSAVIADLVIHNSSVHVASTA